jgi:hypothetical protein
MILTRQNCFVYEGLGFEREENSTIPEESGRMGIDIQFAVAVQRFYCGGKLAG